VLDNPTGLADGTEEEIAPVNQDTPASWAEVLKDVIGTAKGLPSDSARNHDHYLYGTDKK
jgi:hypothetical protein